MAGFSSTNWNLYLRLIGLGVAAKDGCSFIGVSQSAPYVKASRDPMFRLALIDATQLGHALRIVSPDHFADETGQPILDADFEPIPRNPLGRLFAWIKGQSNPLALLAS
ncbi:hypothetical protein LCGC14_1293960 [marine sediment metagenome]|uniref:Uncharacterized protein n=1 Tax=marine sediment metagenome TaxID=412755 RepID=A0A0F9N851_9ZZZZ